MELTLVMYYCILYGIPNYLHNKLMGGLHASARIILMFVLSCRNYFGFNIEQGISFSLLTKVYKATKHWTIFHRTILEYTVVPSSNPKLHQQKWNLKAYGYHAFSIAAPRGWNLLPLHICDSKSLAVFKKSFTNYLFKFGYDC